MMRQALSLLASAILFLSVVNLWMLASERAMLSKIVSAESVTSKSLVERPRSDGSSFDFFKAKSPSGILFRAIEKTPIDASTNIIVTSGYYEIGDLGTGMPMIVGDPSGPLARRSADGRWWILDLQPLQDIPLGFCGALADDQTDNTSAAQLCASIANQSGKLLRIRTGGGVFRVGASGTVNIDTGVIGDGKTLSYLRNMAVDHTLFNCKTRGTPHFVGVHYLPMSSTASKTGATIYIDAPQGTYAFNAEIHQNAFQGQFVDIYCNRCNVPEIYGNFSTNYMKASIILDDIDNADNGDQHIYSNVLDAGSNDTAVGVLQYAAGGLTMTGNKIGNGAHAYQLQLRKGVSTSILKISENSFENQKKSNILLAKDGAQDSSAGIFLYATISDNEFATASSSPANIDIEGGTWLSGVKVSNNVINIGSKYGVGVVFNGGLIVDASNNMFLGYGEATAISVAATVTGRFGPQTNIGTPTLCVCRSVMISYDDFALVKVSPAHATPFNSPEGSNGSGDCAIASFSYTALPGITLSIVADLNVSGIVAGSGESVAHQTLVVSREGQSVFEQLVSKSLGTFDSHKSGFAFTTAHNLNVTMISTSYHAPRFGSKFTAKMRIISGAGIFKTL